MFVDGLVVEPIKDVNAIRDEENRTCSPRRRGVIFDLPLNLNPYILVAPFPGKLVLLKKLHEGMRRNFSSTQETRALLQGKKVWVEVLTGERNKRKWSGRR